MTFSAADIALLTGLGGVLLAKLFDWGISRRAALQLLQSGERDYNERLSSNLRDDLLAVFNRCRDDLLRVEDELQACRTQLIACEAARQRLLPDLPPLLPPSPNNP